MPHGTAWLNLDVTWAEKKLPESFEFRRAGQGVQTEPRVAEKLLWLTAREDEGHAAGMRRRAKARNHNATEQRGWKKKPWKRLICDLSVLTCTLRALEGSEQELHDERRAQGSGLRAGALACAALWPRNQSIQTPSHPEEKLPGLPAVIDRLGEKNHGNKKGSCSNTDVTFSIHSSSCVSADLLAMSH